MNLFKKIEITGRKFILKILTRLLKNNQKDFINISDIKNVIVVRIDERLGNLVLTIPVLNSFLKNKLSVTAIISEKFAPVIETIPELKIIKFNKKKLFNPVYLISYIYKLRKLKFDLLFDASNPNDLSTLTFFLILIINARYKIGFNRKNSSAILNILIEKPLKPVHILDYYKYLFDYLNLKFYKELKIYLKPKNLAFNKNKKLIAVHPGGRGSKRYPVDFLLEALRMIKDKYGNKYEFLIIIGPDEKDLIGKFYEYKVVIPYNVLELAYYLKMCEIFIGNDSGPMHLASALGLKIIAIFKNDAVITFKPVAKFYKILSSNDVKSIKPVEIFKAFQKINL